MRGRPLFAKLFLEGVEVPFIGATITSTVNQAMISYIDVVPHKAINNIKPRTLVQLAVRDTSNPAGGFPYVMAFEGEVFGFSFGKTVNSRMFTLMCIDYTSYWDNVLTYFFNAQQSLGKGTSELAAVAQDTTDSTKQGIKVNPYSTPVSNYFLQVIKKGIASRTGGDFLDGLVQIFKEIGGVNTFYNLASNRLRINDRIRLKSSGDLTKLLEQDRALNWFMGVVGRNSGFATLRGVVQDLMSILFHDFVSVPFPASVNGKPGEYLFKPNMYMLPPPMCNVFYPDEYASFQYSRNFLQEPTRLIYKPEMPYFNGAGSVSLLHIYEPPAFSKFMKHQPPSADMIGTGDTQVPTTPPNGSYGGFGLKGGPASTNGIQREQQFLSNEELLKGILMAQETMVPASSEFRASLPELGRVNFAQNVAKYLFYKRRFQNRQTQITGHLKLSVVPGFTTLIIDDSDAEQSVVAYCSSVTHRIYASQGGYTSTTLSYARTVAEQDATSGKTSEPLIPPWFSSALFGNYQNGQLNVSDSISAFFAALLGSKGSNCITTSTKTKTTSAAVDKLLAAYRAAKKSGGDAVATLIDAQTRRQYVPLKDAFSFLGASTTATNLNNSFIEFRGPQIEGKTGNADDTQIQARRKVILQYRDQLKSQRGFRG